MKFIHILLLLIITSLTACTHFDRDYDSESLINKATKDIALNADTSWQTTFSDSELVDDDRAEPKTLSMIYGFERFNDEQLNRYINKALNNNRNLLAEAKSLEAVIESVNVTGAQRKPTVDGNFRQSYTKANSRDGVFNYDTSLNLRWELDIWSALSDQKKRSLLTAEARAANYSAARLSLAANIAKRWYAINADQLKVSLSEKRLANQEAALSITEEQFKSGRGSAMDIFLSRSDVVAQRARIVSARNQLEQSIRTFKRLLGDYPDIDLNYKPALPELAQSVPAGLPSDLLKRRPDINASMKQWQASILETRIAHKARFPSFALTASYGVSSDELLKASASDFVFNLVNNLTVPLFQGGRLASNLKQTELEAESAYQQYVETLLLSFEEVESALSAENYLKEQLNLLEQAENFARSAYELAFEQYQSGLIRYSNLLDFEQRWFATQSDIITLKNSRLANRINLHLALGGDFVSTQ